MNRTKGENKGEGDSSPSVEESSSSESSSSSSEIDDASETSQPSIEDFLTQPDVCWTGYNQHTSHHISSEKPVFRAEPGIKADLSHLQNPIDFFNLFFHDKYIQDLCCSTHSYYRNSPERRRKPRDSHSRNWSKPDSVEMRAFLGLLLFTRIVKKPDILVWEPFVWDPWLCTSLSKGPFSWSQKEPSFRRRKNCW